MLACREHLGMHSNWEFIFLYIKSCILAIKQQ